MEMTTQEFTCKNDDCSMTFTCEDQLLAHHKRHEMVLNLGPLKANLFNTDRTPTPTRFIRNCDEVGLFQDLQHVNPFEETFRRAVEQNKNGGSTTLATPLSNNLNDDTLHTPHIFPNFSTLGENSFLVRDEQSVVNETNQTIASQSSLSSKPESANVADDKSINKETKIYCDIDTASSHSSNSFESIQIRNDHIVPSKEITIPKVSHLINISNSNGIVLPVLEQIQEEIAEQLIVTNNLTLQNQTVNDISSVKKQLKATILKNTQQPVIEAALLNNSTNVITNVQAMPPMILSNSCALPINGLRNILPKDVPKLKRSVDDKKAKPKTHKNKDIENARHMKANVKLPILNINEKPQKTKNTDDEQREQFLARNRAAASRWRVKKREQMRELHRRNQQLEYENTTLKTECAELKKILLAHKNCTLAIPQSMISGPITTMGSITTSIQNS